MLYGIGSLSVVRIEDSAADYMNPTCFSEFIFTKRVEKLVHQALVDDTIKTVGIENDVEEYELTLRSQLNNIDSLGFADDRQSLNAGGTNIQTFYEITIPVGGSVILPSTYTLTGTDGVFNLSTDEYLLEVIDYNFSGNPLGIIFNSQYEGDVVKISVQFTVGTLREISDERIGKIVFTGIVTTKLNKDEDEQLLIQIDDLRPIGAWNMGINGSGASIIESRYIAIQGSPAVKLYRIS